MRKLILAVLLPLLLLILPTGCDIKNTVNTNDSIDSTTLRMGVVPTLDCLPFYIAQDKGIFLNLGLDIQLFTYSCAMNCDTAFLRRHLDCSVSDIVKAQIWNADGDSIHGLMTTDLRLYLLTSRQARIMNKESIKEKIIAITRNSVCDMTLDHISQSVKLQQNEVNKPQINDFDVRLGMLTQNQYDGALLPEPYASMAMQRGARRIGDSKDYCKDLALLVAHHNTVKDRHNDLALLVKAYNIAVDTINSHIKADQGRQLLSSLPVNGLENDTTLVLSPFRHAALPTDSCLAKAKEWAQGRELITTKSTYKNLIDSAFVKTAK